MMNTLISVGVLVILLIAALIAFRMNQSGNVRRRDYRRVKLLARERALTLHQIGQKIRAYRPSLDVVGSAFADEVEQLITDHDQKLININYTSEDDR